MLVEVFEPEHPRGRWYCYCAYLAPAIVVAVSAAVFPSGYGTPRHCWLSTEKMFVMSFVGPVALVLLVSSKYNIQTQSDIVDTPFLPDYGKANGG